MKRAIVAGVCVAGAMAVAVPAWAHFILVSPDSWIEANALGDPQKAAPCGTSDITAGAPTGKVTAMRGGDAVHFKVKETVYHPGHYRVALSVLDRKELPKDPVAITKDGPRGPISVFAEVDPAPKPPVLVDGLWPHRARPDKDAFWEADVKLPNINCEKCTVQIIQFMEQHPLNKEGEYTYHHCADVKITVNPALPIDKRWPGQKKGG